MQLEHTPGGYLTFPSTLISIVTFSPQLDHDMGAMKLILPFDQTTRFLEMRRRAYRAAA
ncbi:MAG: hypothetical protein JJT96_09980 [Opitutales bacterium]|nr:hypothetical protein [Opitutales bacterium]